VLNHSSRNSTPGSYSSKVCGLDHTIELNLIRSLLGWAGSGCLGQRRSMLVGSTFGIEVDVPLNLLWINKARAKENAIDWLTLSWSMNFFFLKVNPWQPFSRGWWPGAVVEVRVPWQPLTRGRLPGAVVEVRVPRGSGVVEGKGKLLVVLVLLTTHPEVYYESSHPEGGEHFWLSFILFIMNR
jgi:hypothetical protein